MKLSTYLGYIYIYIYLTNICNIYLNTIFFQKYRFTRRSWDAVSREEKKTFEEEE